MRKILCALSGTLLLAACDTMPGARPEPFRGEFPAYRYSGWQQDRPQAMTGAIVNFRISAVISTTAMWR